MGITSTLQDIFKKCPFLQKFLIKRLNHLQLNGNSFNVPDIHSQNNKVTMQGKGNDISCKQQSIARDNIFQISGDKNSLTVNSQTTLYGENGLTVYIHGTNNKVVIGENCSLRKAQFFISGNNNCIILGNGCSAYNVEFHIEQDHNEIQIGNGTTMHGRDSYPIHLALDEGSKITIDEDCMLSNNIHIRSTDSHSIVDMEGKRLNPAKDIYIGKHCWLGLGCMILKGTQIAENTVVAASSVCSKKYSETNCVIAGNPASIVKHGTNWDRKFVK